jgi:hypothetical protein
MVRAHGVHAVSYAGIADDTELTVTVKLTTTVCLGYDSGSVKDPWSRFCQWDRQDLR